MNITIEQAEVMITKAGLPIHEVTGSRSWTFGVKIGADKLSLGWTASNGGFLSHGERQHIFHSLTKMFADTNYEIDYASFRLNKAGA